MAVELRRVSCPTPGPFRGSRRAADSTAAASTGPGSRRTYTTSPAGVDTPSLESSNRLLWLTAERAEDTPLRVVTPAGVCVY